MEKAIEERNIFAKTHKVIADQTHVLEGTLIIISFYDDGYNPIEALKQEIKELKALLQERKA